MNGLLKVLAKHKALTVMTFIVILVAPLPLLLGIISIIWLVKILNNVDVK